jgi:DNA-binding FrmR family transcriptional regulator
MKLSDERSKEAMLNRLRRIEGQVRGLQAMIVDDRECREILQQMNATRSALQSASMTLMQEYATNCLLSVEQKNQVERQDMLQDLMTMISKS